MPRHALPPERLDRDPAWRTPARAALLRRGLVGLVVLAGIVGLIASATAASGQTSAKAANETAAAAARILDTSGWYLTLPTGSKGKPDTVEPPDLAGYSSKWFHLTSGKDGVVFTANAGGVTTSGSSYPRSELREMDGSRLAGWSNTQGTHTLTVREAVTTLPSAKPDVVTAQIHDSSDDVMEVRLEGSKLIAQYNDGRTDVTLDSHYELGTPYDLTITASGGRIRVYYNGAKKLDIAKRGSGWYFKAGSYVQSNTSKGDKASTVGVVVIYRVTATHTS
jgi:Alginate lyase